MDMNHIHGKQTRLTDMLISLYNSIY